MDKKNEIVCILARNLRCIMKRLAISYDKLYEVRLRVQEPLLIIYDGEEYFVSDMGTLEKRKQCAYVVTELDIKETLEFISNYSLYAYEDEIRHGFITVQGGHRVGIAGTVAVDEGKIKSVRHISFINIRVSHQVRGCANGVLPYLWEDGQVYHTLIISPPRCGKTTLLRDIVRCISDGDGENAGMTVGVVDERSEIGACFRGMPQNDLGIRTDVLDCCPKVTGMMMLIRSMSPQVIAVDEIGSVEDIEAISYVIHCGCKILATVHGKSIDDIKNKPVLRKLVEEKTFERYVVLDGSKKAGQISSVFDSMGNQLFHRKRDVC